MTNYKIINFNTPILLVGFLLSWNFVTAATPPIITGIDPTNVSPGQQVQISGTDLGNDVELRADGGEVIHITGSVNSQLTIVKFTVPSELSPGNYSVSVVSTGGTATITNTLTVKVEGKPFQQPPVIAPPTQGLPTDLGQLIQMIFVWSLGILGIAVFVMFFYSGFLWLTAAGNTSRVGDAKSHMTNAGFGAVLLLSSYLILYTINPDFVKNTFNLPGLGNSQSNSQLGVPPPADALTKHPSQANVVDSIIQDLKTKGFDPSANCAAFEVTKRAAWQLKGEGAGLLSKPSGSNCGGYASDIIAYPDGYIYDVVTSSIQASWSPSGCGTIQSNGTCPDRYKPVINPGQ